MSRYINSRTLAIGFAFTGLATAAFLVESQKLRVLLRREPEERFHGGLAGGHLDTALRAANLTVLYASVPGGAGSGQDKYPSRDTPHSRPAEAGQCAKCSVELAAAYKKQAIPNNQIGHQTSYDSLSGDARGLLGLKRRLLPAGPDTKYTLFVFFSPADCASCLQEARTWQELQSRGSELQLSVIGLVDQSSADEALQFVREMNLTFPVIFDRTDISRRAFAVPQTPYKVLVTQEGSVLLTDIPNQTDSRQKMFERTVLKAVGATEKKE